MELAHGEVGCDERSEPRKVTRGLGTNGTAHMMSSMRPTRQALPPALARF
jgi:hypothetical protein